MTNTGQISILGGGIAGLAAAYYAKQMGMHGAVYEASDRIGGNCVTYQHGNFFYDSGAHRLHDKDPEITSTFVTLLGDNIRKVDAPSHIYHEGNYIEFPLNARDLLRVLGPLTVARAGVEILSERLFSSSSDENFEQFALQRYGKTIASHFLLNYSEKLWGAPCSSLSPVITGKRLKGLDLRTFIAGSLTRRAGNKPHMEGSFYYPSQGIGMLAESLSNICGDKAVKKNARITKILHDEQRIKAVEINGRQMAATEKVISTLPLNLFVRLLDPAPPSAISEAIGRLRFRDIMLVALFLDKESVSDDATIYFPSGEFPFTRVYEPRNRSQSLSPPGKTSLVAEIPCHHEDELWHRDDAEIISRIIGILVHTGCFQKEEILGAEVRRLRHAYPVLETGFEKNVAEVFDYLDRFRNLRLSGRNGKFVYAWIHDMMRFGREAVEGLIA